MSEPQHRLHGNPKNERGTTWSYVIGFLLSLIFTITPYYLVVNKLINGSGLLATILGFAVLQMLIQIFFFLHLGRGPKPLYNVVFFASTVGIILVVIGGSIWIINHLNYNMASKDVTTFLAQNEAIYQVDGQKTGACQGTKTNHKVTISGGRVNPTTTTAQLCDTLTFINEDGKVREIAFGPYPQRQTYGGESAQLVRKSYPKTINLNQSGTFQFYDDLDPSVLGYFYVSSDN